MKSDPDISWPRLAAFMRQHTHDVRNGLNCLDLEAALLQEIVSDEEGRASVGRVRQQVRELAERLRTLSAFFQEPQPCRGPLAASELLLIWREQHESLPEPPAVEWLSDIGLEMVNVDAAMLAQALRELLLNARTFCERAPATASVRREGDHVVFELREPKSQPIDCESWSRSVFASTKRGGYGLGLCAVKRLVEANGGTFTQQGDKGALLTRVALPVCE